MARFLLIHGSAQGVWCWRDVAPALERPGHEARAIDLPGNGADGTPLAEVTLDRCAEGRAIPPEFLCEMAARIAPGEAYEMRTGHLPFFAAPVRLAEILDEIAEKT